MKWVVGLVLIIKYECQVKVTYTYGLYVASTTGAIYTPFF